MITLICNQLTITKYNENLFIFIGQTAVKSPLQFCSFKNVPELAPEQLSSSSLHYSSLQTDNANQTYASSSRNFDLNKTPEENEAEFQYKKKQKKT